MDHPSRRARGVARSPDFVVVACPPLGWSASFLGFSLSALGKARRSDISTTVHAPHPVLRWSGLAVALLAVSRLTCSPKSGTTEALPIAAPVTIPSAARVESPPPTSKLARRAQSRNVGERWFSRARPHGSSLQDVSRTVVPSTGRPQRTHTAAPLLSKPRHPHRHPPLTASPRGPIPHQTTALPRPQPRKNPAPRSLNPPTENPSAQPRENLRPRLALPSPPRPRSEGLHRSTVRHRM